MNKPPRYSEAIKAYLHRLGNPYASLQISDDPENDQNERLSTPLGSYKVLQNPYAKLSMGEDPETAGKVSSNSTAISLAQARTGALSKAEFRARSSRIFKQYIPELEKGRLRAHQRDFITRNQSCSPTKRYRLVKHLEKYDLSNVEGLKPRFNREREPLTEQKLKLIERLVESED